MISWKHGQVVFHHKAKKSSHLYLYSAFNKTDYVKALSNIKIGKYKYFEKKNDFVL